MRRLEGREGVGERTRQGPAPAPTAAPAHAPPPQATAARGGRRPPYTAWEEAELREAAARVGLARRDSIRSNRFILIAAAKPGDGGL
jgi:hypothetical protein